LSSDHNPIILSIYDSTIPPSPPKAKKKVNWKRFEEQLLWNLPKINNHIINITDIDNEISSFTASIQSSLENNSYTIRQPLRKEPITPEIQLEITTKITKTY